MLDYVMELLPSPMDKDTIVGTNPDTNAEVPIKPDEKGPFVGWHLRLLLIHLLDVFVLSEHIPGYWNQVLMFTIRVQNNKERISRVFQMHANKQNQIERLSAGDIGAVVGFKDIKTGDTLCDEKHKVVLESMVFPEPVIGYAIEPKKQADVDKLGMAISKLVEEDPTLRVHTDQETGQTILRGMGELHLEIIIDRLKREFKVEINQGAPQVAYKEALTKIS